MPPKNKKKNVREHLPQLLILIGVVLVVTMIFILKKQDSPVITAQTNETAEEQLSRYVEAGIPVFAFFHSNNCQSCLLMMDTVDQVYPSYKDQIALVDVDVYDPINQNLLRQAGVYSIPTQIFFDINGQGKVTIGAMNNEELAQQFNNLLGE